MTIDMADIIDTIGNRPANTGLDRIYSRGMAQGGQGFSEEGSIEVRFSVNWRPEKEGQSHMKDSPLRKFILLIHNHSNMLMCLPVPFIFSFPVSESFFPILVPDPVPSGEHALLNVRSARREIEDPEIKTESELEINFTDKIN